MLRHLFFLRIDLIALVLGLIGGLCAGCDDSPPTIDHPEPGLEILTPTLGVPTGGRASILLRSDQPARVAVYTDDVLIGTGRSGRDITEIRFSSPDWIEEGSTAILQVIAVSEGGTTDTQDVTIEGLGDIQSWTLDSSAQEFTDVAALGSTAVLLASSRLWTVSRDDDELAMSDAFGEFRAIVADEERRAVVVADRAAQISVYTLSTFGELNLNEQFEFAIYDGSSPPEEVIEVNALHVNGPLVAAATGQGMALMDRDTVDGEETYCRRRSAMTAKIEPAIFDPAMYSVVATHTERVVAGGAYLNLYDTYEDNDPGGCSPAFPARGTSVIAPPEGQQSWDIVGLALTQTFIWLGRRDAGLQRIPTTFETENHYFKEEDLRSFPPEALPLPRVVDLAEGEGDHLWVALTDADEIEGGIARIGQDGVELWIDSSSLGGVPQAIDVSPAATPVMIWVLANEAVMVFTAS